MIFLLGSAIISGIGAACASTAATVGTVAATTSAGGILGGLGATAGLGLLAKGAVAGATKATTAKVAAGIVGKCVTTSVAKEVGKCVAMSVAKEVGESFVKNVLCDQVRPVRGSILKVDLVGGKAEHTGVYLGNDRIAEVTEVNGRAKVQVVSPEAFLSGEGLLRTGAYIYVASAKDGGRYRPVASESIARRAEQAVGGRGKYNLYGNNCHMFTRYCITGRDGVVTLSASGVAHALRDEIGVGHISWRSTGCGTGNDTFA